MLWRPFCQIIGLGPVGRKLAPILVFRLTFAEIGMKTQMNVIFSLVKLFCTERKGSQVCLKKTHCIAHYYLYIGLKEFTSKALYTAQVHNPGISNSMWYFTFKYFWCIGNMNTTSLQSCMGSFKTLFEVYIGPVFSSCGLFEFSSEKFWHTTLGCSQNIKPGQLKILKVTKNPWSHRVHFKPHLLDFSSAPQTEKGVILLLQVNLTPPVTSYDR